MKHQPNSYQLPQRHTINHRKMPVIKDFIPITWKLRDYFASKYPDRGVRAWSYTTLIEHVKQELSDDEDQISEEIKSFVTNCYVKKRGIIFGNDRNVDNEQVIENLLHNSNKRSYRMVIGSDVMDDDDDNRVRDLLNHIMNHTTISLYGFSCNFFCERGIEKRPGLDRDDLMVDISSRFEQILHISLLYYLLSENGKRRKKSRESMNNVPMFKPDSKNGQCAGWGIQKVVSAWDSYAKMIGFHDAEEMFFPYLQLQEEGIKFKVLSNRSDGYIPMKYKKNLQFPIIPTNDVSCIPEYLKNMSDEVDKFLRELCELFLKDLYEVILLRGLYEEGNITNLIEIQKFVSMNTSLPSRFTSISISFSKLSEAREEVRRILPNEREVKLRMRRTETSGMKRKGSRQLVGSSSKMIKTEVIGIEMRNKEEPMLIPHPVSTRSKTRKENENRNMRITKSKQPMDMTSDILKMEKCIEKYVKMYLSEFNGVLDDHEYIALEVIEEKVQLVLTDPPYNIRREQNKIDSDYDSMTRDDMEEVVKVIGRALRSGGHGIIFCSYQQYEKWVSLFRNEKRNDGSEVFSVDPVPFHFVRDCNHFSNNPGRSTTKLLSSVEYGVHVKKNGLPYSQEMRMINYHGFNHVKSTMQGYRNVIDKIKGLVRGEQVTYFNYESKEWRPIRFEQKPIALLKELICRFSQPGDIVIDLFAGTFSTAIACFQLKDHRRFIGCEKDHDCFDVSRDNVVRRFSEMLLSGNGDIKMNENELDLAKSLISSDLFKPFDNGNWNQPKGCPMIQTFPIHIIGYISSIWNEMKIYEEYRNIPATNWDENYYSKLEQLDIETALNIDAISQGIMMIKLNNEEEEEEEKMKYVAMRSFQKDQVVCTFYGTLVYHEVTNLESTTKTYGNGIMGVTQNEIEKYGKKIFIYGKNDETNNLPKIHGKSYVTIVPSKFCIARYLLKNDAIEESNLKLYDTNHRVNSFDHLVSHSLVQVRAKKWIRAGEEIFMKSTIDNMEIVEL